MIHEFIRLAILVAVTGVCPRLAPAQSEPIGFTTPSNNIYCMVEPPYEDHPFNDLRCDLQQMTSKPPLLPKDCPLEWGDAFSIGQGSDIGIRICHGDTTKNDEFPVLPYGAEWNHSGFVCQSAASGLTCKNAAGHGFTLSIAGQSVF